MTTIEIIGWIGAICFALSALPQTIKSIKEGHSNGLSWGLLFLWVIGESCSLIYVLDRNDLPLFTNYAINIIFLFIILYYKFFPKK